VASCLSTVYRKAGSHEAIRHLLTRSLRWNEIYSTMYYVCCLAGLQSSAIRKTGMGHFCSMHMTKRSGRDLQTILMSNGSVAGLVAGCCLPRAGYISRIPRNNPNNVGIPISPFAQLGLAHEKDPQTLITIEPHCDSHINAMRKSRSFLPLNAHSFPKVTSKVPAGLLTG
jgi:hypothetical protein